LIAATSLSLLSFPFEGAARANPGACSTETHGRGCVEACELRAGPDARASELFVGKLRTIAPTGRHVDGGTDAGASSPTAVPQFRVASIPLPPEAAARWRQNGLWAGPCTGLEAVFQARTVDNKDAHNVIELYELRYTAEATASRVAALLGTSWDWNGHPFITVQKGPNVIIAEGRYGALSALEGVGAHFGGTIYPRGGPVALPVCDKGSTRRPIFQGEGLTVHVLGFAPSGELAWLEQTIGQGGAVWTLRVSNLVNDRELAARTYRTVRRSPDAFCAQYRDDAGALLSERGVSGREFVAFDQPTIDGTPLSVLIQPGPSSGNQVVMQGPSGIKVLGRLPAAARGAKALGFIRSPFEERVAVMLLTRNAATHQPELRVLGGRLDKRWLPKQ
jgi:hypothetical protein